MKKNHHERNINGIVPVIHKVKSIGTKYYVGYNGKRKNSG
jgi:hypothetical protein